MPNTEKGSTISINIFDFNGTAKDWKVGTVIGKKVAKGKGVIVRKRKFEDKIEDYYDRLEEERQVVASYCKEVA